MKIKPGVTLIGIQPQIAIALVILDPIFKTYGEHIVITEGTAGDPHMHTSKHRIGFAIDIRSKHIDNEGIKNDILGDIRHALGHEFYAQISNPGKDNECFHIQYNGVA